MQVDTTGKGICQVEEGVLPNNAHRGRSFKLRGTGEAAEMKQKQLRKLKLVQGRGRLRQWIKSLLLFYQTYSVTGGGVENVHEFC